MKVSEEIMGLLEDIGEFKFDFNNDESVKVSNANEVQKVLDFLYSNNIRLSMYLKQVMKLKKFSDVVEHFGYIGRLGCFPGEVSAVTKDAAVNIITFDEYNERFINKESKEEVKMKETKYYDIPDEIMSGISSLSDDQRAAINNKGIVLNFLEPKATENQIRFVYSIICDAWKEKFEKEFSEIFRHSDEEMMEEMVSNIDRAELFIITNSMIDYRNSGEMSGKSFYLNRSYKGRPIKWEIATDSEGAQVLVAKRK